MKYLLVTVSLLTLSSVVAGCASKTAMNTFADEPFVEAKVITEPTPPMPVNLLPRPEHLTASKRL